MSLLDRIKGLFNKVFKRQQELPPVVEEPEEKKEDVFDTVFEVDEYDFDPKIIEDDSGKTQSIGEMIEELDVKGRNDRRNPIRMDYDPSRDDKAKDKKDYTLKTEVSESDIKLDFDSVSKVKITDASLNTYDEEGRSFVQKKVEVKDKDGDYLRVSDLTIGHNREGFLLEDGEYASYDEIMKALEKALKPDHNLNQVVRVKSKTTGKYIDTKELTNTIAGIIRGNSKFEIQNEPKKDDELDSAFVKVRNDRDDFIKKGLLILGEGNITLPNGEYVSKKDIETALGMYLFETKTFTLEKNNEEDINGRHVARDEEGNPIVTELDSDYVGKHTPKVELAEDIYHDVKDEELEAELEEDIPEVIERPKKAGNYTRAGYVPPQNEKMDRPEDRMKYTKAGYVPPQKEGMERPENRMKYTRAGYSPKHVKRTGRKWKVWPLVLAGVATISLGYGIKHVPRDPQDNFVASYKLVQLYEKDRPETEDEVIRRINSQFEIGKTVAVPDGVVVHASSDYTQEGANKSQGIIGKRSLQLNGQAKIDYISLIDASGRIVQVTYDKEQDANVEDAINRAVQENGFDRNTGKVMLHLSGVNIYGKEVQAGWAEQSDLITEEDKTPRQISTYEEGPVISNTKEGFNGSVVLDAPDGAHIVGNIPNLDFDNPGEIIGTKYTDINGNIIEFKEINIENHPIEQKDGVELEWEFDNVEKKKALVGLFAALGVAGFGVVNKEKFAKDTKDKTNKHDEEPSL